MPKSPHAAGPLLALDACVQFKLFALSVALLTAGAACSAQIGGDDIEESVSEVRVGNFPGPDGMLRANYVVRGDLAIVGGDMAWPLHSALSIASASAGGFTPLRRWEGGIVPYLVSDDFPFLAQVKKGVAAWNAVSDRTGVRFVERTNEESFLVIEEEQGCFSSVGSVFGGQKLGLNAECLAIGPAVVEHELGHALGLIHELQRSDRDSYVEFQFDNMVDGSSNRLFVEQMDIVQGSVNYSDYDYESVMHYGAFNYHSSVAIDPSKPIFKTLRPNSSERDIIVDRISEGDIAGVAAMYAGYGSAGGERPAGSCAIATCSEFGVADGACQTFGSGSFQCDKGCLKARLTCNDEGTGEDLGEGEFVCDNGESFPATFECDGLTDCADDSDEAKCGVSPSDPGTAENNPWGTCTANGQAGECLDTSVTTCFGTLHTGACPGPNEIRCCT